jgi:hypothetical protein
VSSRTLRAIQRNPVLKNQKPKNKKKKKKKKKKKDQQTKKAHMEGASVAIQQVTSVAEPDH